MPRCPNCNAEPQRQKISCPLFSTPWKHTPPWAKSPTRCAASSGNTRNPSSSEVLGVFCKMKYRALWFTEIVLIVLLLGVVYVPVQDYAMTEYKEYLRHPSP